MGSHIKIALVLAWLHSFCLKFFYFPKGWEEGKRTHPSGQKTGRKNQFIIIDGWVGNGFSIPAEVFVLSVRATQRTTRSQLAIA